MIRQPCVGRGAKSYIRAPPKTSPVAEHAPRTASSASKILKIALLFLRFLTPNLRHDARTRLGPRFPEVPMSRSTLAEGLILDEL